MSSTAQDVMLLWTMGFKRVAAENIDTVCVKNFKLQQVSFGFCHQKHWSCSGTLVQQLGTKILQVCELMISPWQSATLHSNSFRLVEHENHIKTHNYTVTRNIQVKWTTLKHVTDVMQRLLSSTSGLSDEDRLGQVVGWVNLAWCGKNN